MLRKRAIDDVDYKSDRRAQYITFQARRTVALPQRAENVDAIEKIRRRNRAVPARVRRQCFTELWGNDVINAAIDPVEYFRQGFSLLGKVYTLMDAGEIPYAKFGKSRRVPIQALKEYARNYMVALRGTNGV